MSSLLLDFPLTTLREGAVSCILVIDDDAATREVLELTLSDEGYQVLQATNGAAALDLLSRHQPDVILLDTRMPIMDGWQFLEAYHQRSEPPVPIVGLTADSATLPTDALVRKPFDIDELLGTIRCVLQPQSSL